MDICKAVERELDQVTSKFGSMSKESIAQLEDIIGTLKGVRNNIRDYEGAGDGIVLENEARFASDCKVLLDTIRKIPESVNKIGTEHRELHKTVCKVGKAIDKNFPPCKSFGPIARDDKSSADEKGKILTQVISQHLCRIGMFDLGDKLSQESGLNLDLKQKQAFVELLKISEDLKVGNLEPALKWAEENHQALLQQGSSLEFKLHRLAFVNIVKKNPCNPIKAVMYARKSFAPFVDKHEKDIQVLMGALLFAKGPLTEYDSPYCHVFSPNNWQDILETFNRDARVRLGLSIDSPLAICFDSGCAALPALHHISKVMEVGKVTNFWSGKNELPIEIDLGKSYHYHSVFACPILRQQTSKSNPAMRLICGHVICRDALRKLTTANKLKCPYCPVIQKPSQVRPIIF